VQYARLGTFRLNNSRLYYVAVPPAVTGVRLLIGGAWISYAHKARVEGASVTQALNEAPDTATMRFDGSIDQPLLGQGIAITQNNPYGEEWVFSGHIMAVRTVYEGRARNVAYECDCIDYTWTLNFRKVSRRYVGQTAAAIVTDLVSRYAPPAPPGFAVSIAAEVPATPIDEITFTNEELASAISRVCERLGLYWLVDYLGIVRVFTSTALGSAGTITQTDARTASKLARHRDLSPVATIISARGGGSTATIDMPVGSTTLPVDDAVWYALGGGYVECGPQVIQYLGVSTPVTGALVGSGNAPTVAPTVNAATGSNLATGAAYQYAVSFVTSAGETLAGPARTYVPVGATLPPAPAPGVPGDIRDSGSPSYGQNKMVNGGSYRWAWAKYITGGANVPGTPSAPVTVNNTNNWQIRVPNELYDGTVTGLTPYRTTNGGSVFYADYHTLTGSPGTGAGWLTTGTFSDADLAGGPTMGGSGATLLAATLSQIPTRVGATARKVYRTAANGSQLKLVGTIADNTTTTFLDTVADGALGANAPITDTSGIQGGGQINAGAPSILVSNPGPFPPGGGWVRVSGLTLRYTGVSGSSLVLEAPLPTTLSYGSEIASAPHLIGIPASGAWSIVYPIKGGDEVYVFVNRWDDTAISNLAAWIGYGDGQRFEFLTDGRLSLAELTTRADAMLAYRKDPLVTVTFETRDPAVSVGKTITFNTTSPPIVGTFLVQRVGIDQFPAAAHVKPVAARRVVEASSRRYTFDDLVQQIKLLGRIN
jgi:hypothetical protein